MQNRHGGRRVGLDTPLDELKYEYDRLKKMTDLSASIKFQRRVLMATVSGIEYLNKKFNPLKLHLDGWSEQVMDSLEDFDQTFEQLHEKYRGTSEVSPEWNLMIMLLGSGFMFHLSNSLFKSVLPNVNDVAKNNPDLMSQIASAMGNAMGGGGGASGGASGAPPAAGAQSTTEMGVNLAMEAMRQKLRPESQGPEPVVEDITGSAGRGAFQQTSALRPPNAEPPPRGVLQSNRGANQLGDVGDLSELSELGDLGELGELGELGGVREVGESESESDLSSDLSSNLTEASDIRQAVSKRKAAPPRAGKGGAKRAKKKVQISI